MEINDVIKIDPFFKIKARDSEIEDAIDEDEPIPTSMVGFCIFIPGKVYYIVSGDNTCGKYATKIISVKFTEKGTEIIHKPFKVSEDSNVYDSGRPTFFNAGASGPFSLR